MAKKEKITKKTAPRKVKPTVNEELKAETVVDSISNDSENKEMEEALTVTESLESPYLKEEKEEERVKIQKQVILDLLSEKKNEDKSVETMNGDPSVTVPRDEVLEIEKEAFKETFKGIKENKHNSKIIDKMFGYSWNGQEIDF